MDFRGPYQRPLRKIDIDGLSPDMSGISFFRISFLREIYSGMDEMDPLNRELIFQPKYPDINSMPYLKPFLRNELSST